jgi:putative ABC transport system substrate-binding protein
MPQPRVPNSLGRRDVLLSLGRWTASAAGLALLGGCESLNLKSVASTSPKLRRVGFLSLINRFAVQAETNAFVDQLRQLGWIDGENLTTEWRFAEGHAELLPQLAAELVRLPVEVLVTPGAATAVPAHQQTTTIPIVLAGVGESTIAEFVQNIARPVGNVTGVGIGLTTI